MGNSIVRFNFDHLRTEPHAGYHEKMERLFFENDPDKMELRQNYDVYKPLVVDELSVLDIIRKSEFTVELEAQDRVRDSIYRGLVDAVKSSLNHYSEEKRIAAFKIESIVDHYGNIAAKRIDEETMALDDFILELNTEPNPTLIHTLGLADWISELDKENRRFKELMDLRYKDVSKRPVLRMANVRKAVDRAFRDMLDQLEALIRVKGIEPYENLVREINTINERYKNLLAQQKGIRDKNKGNDKL